MKTSFRVMIILLSAVLMFSLAMTFCSCNSNERRVVVDNMVANGTQYTIVIPAVCTSSQRYAAEQIASYFLQVTGSEIKVKTDDGKGFSKDDTVISLGNTNAYKSVVQKNNRKVDLSSDALNIDGFVIFTEGKSVFINSYNDRGIIYGAQEFIEDTLGVKWLSYDYTHVPSKSKVTLYEYDKAYVPAFHQRCFLNSAVFHKHDDYVVHMRFNTDYDVLPENMGGSTRWAIINGSESHTLPYIIKPERYYTVSTGGLTVNPLYKDCLAHTGSGDSSEVATVNDGTLSVLDMCYTSGVNEDGTMQTDSQYTTTYLLLEELKKIVVEQDFDFIMLGQADRPYGCPCDRCVQARQNYTASGLMIRFVNCVSAELQRWMQQEGINKDIKFALFAYSYNERAPLDNDGNLVDASCVPNSNVYIKYAPISSIFYYALNDSRQNAESLGMYEKWAKVTDRLMTWTYHSYYNNWYWYYPTMQTFSDTINLMKDVHTEYAMAQSTFNEYPVYQQHMDAYVYSKLCWDTSANVKDLRNEWLYYYFGADAYENMVLYHDTMDARYSYIEQQGASMRPTDSITNPEYWPYEFINKQIDLFDQAMAKTNANGNLSAEQKAQYVKNIERAKLMPLWMKLYNAENYTGLTQSDVSDLAKEWITTAEKYGAVRYAETLTSTVSSLREKYHIN